MLHTFPFSLSWVYSSDLAFLGGGLVFGESAFLGRLLFLLIFTLSLNFLCQKGSIGSKILSRMAVCSVFRSTLVIEGKILVSSIKRVSSSSFWKPSSILKKTARNSAACLVCSLGTLVLSIIFYIKVVDS